MAGKGQSFSCAPHLFPTRAVKIVTAQWCLGHRGRGKNPITQLVPVRQGVPHRDAKELSVSGHLTIRVIEDKLAAGLASWVWDPRSHPGPSLRRLPTLKRLGILTLQIPELALALPSSPSAPAASSSGMSGNWVKGFPSW